jgi:hypothetical protein
MIVEVYSSKSEGSFTVFEKGSTQNIFLLADDAILMYEIEKETWNECMTEHHKLMG